MIGLSLQQILLLCALLAPLFMWMSITLSNTVAHKPSETFIRSTIGILSLSSLLFSLGLFLMLLWTPGSVEISFFNFISHRIDISAAALLLLSTSIISVVGNFSATYLHLDPGFQRYFFSFSLFFVGITQLFSAASTVVFVAGWECIGISSALLIAFFQERREPIKNSLLAFTYYRIGDIGLLSGLALLYHRTGNHTLAWFNSELIPNSSALLLPLAALAVAAAVKMSLFPFGSWLSRAMEGPTPSSAIYYGALSVHAGAFLLWRLGPLLSMHTGASLVLKLVGLLTLLFASSIGRIRPDVKTQLAFASMAQLGIITMEIGFGWYDLALWHIMGHMSFRTLQFLSAPSTLHHFHHLQILRAGASRTLYLERLLPKRIQTILYRLALAEFHVHDLLMNLFVLPVLSLSEGLLSFDRRILEFLRSQFEGSMTETLEHRELLVPANPSIGPITEGDFQ